MQRNHVDGQSLAVLAVIRVAADEVVGPRLVKLDHSLPIVENGDGFA